MTEPRILSVESLQRTSEHGQAVISITAVLEEFCSNGYDCNDPSRLDWDCAATASTLLADFPVTFDQAQQMEEGELIDLLQDLHHLDWKEEEEDPTDYEMMSAFGMKWHDYL